MDVPSVGALGFRVKSGWAAAALLRGHREAPELSFCMRVQLSDPDPATRQPYHARFGTLETDENVLSARLEAVRRCALASVDEVLERCARDGVTLRGVGIVAGSLADPGRIANEHIRAHALEGLLFRSVLAERIQESMIPCRFLLERDLWAEAGRALGIPESDLKPIVAELGRGRASPWRADEKLAATAAWTML